MNPEPDHEERPRPAAAAAAARARPPRFGPFVTIAVAILLLFGAASRMGKPAETAALFNIDQTAVDRLRLEEARRTNEEARLRTFLAIGAAPAAAREEPPAVAMALEEDPAPPYRGEFDLAAQRRANEETRRANEERGAANEQQASGRAMVSLAVPVTAAAAQAGAQTGTSSSPDQPPRTVHDPIPEAPPAPLAPPNAGARAYVVTDGDTWVKIAKATLGDAKRWQDIQAANPPAKNGLRVGMRLVIPQ